MLCTTMFQTNYEYINKETIPRRLLCELCKSPYIDPVSTKCNPNGHTYCRHCMNIWLTLSSSCPTASCGQKVCKKDLTTVSHPIIIGTLDDLATRCLGCVKTTTKRIDFEAHYNNECPKTHIGCPSFGIGCLWRGLKNELDKHLDMCMFHNILKPMQDVYSELLKCANDQNSQQEKVIKMLQTEKKQHIEEELKQRSSTRGPLRGHQLPNAQVNQQTQMSVVKKALPRQSKK